MKLSADVEGRQEMSADEDPMRERERENLSDFALRTDTIIRLIIHKKNH